MGRKIIFDKADYFERNEFRSEFERFFETDDAVDKRKYAKHNIVDDFKLEQQRNRKM